MANESIIALVAFGITGVISAFLAVCKRYDAGVIGLIGASIMTVSAVAMLIGVIQGWNYRFPKEVVGFAIGAATFFSWYIYRFLRKQWRLRKQKE